MANVLEISNWYQLTRATSDNENLRIYVTQANGELLQGIKISVVDYNTNFVYFCAFADVIESSIIPESGKMTNDAMLEMLNSFGFHVKYSEPTKLSENVITILNGLYALGYQYIYKYYTDNSVYHIYASVNIKEKISGFDIVKQPDYIEDEWDWCEAFKSYAISDLVESGTVNNGLPI